MQIKVSPPLFPLIPCPHLLSTLSIHSSFLAQKKQAFCGHQQIMANLDAVRLSSSPCSKAWQGNPV